MKHWPIQSLAPRGCSVRRRYDASRGFSLIELLVACAIIAILAGLLVPLGARARESARRARCEANLHSIGGAAHAFAVDHGGLLPASYLMPDAKYPFRFPAVITRDARMDTQLAWWTKYGTPWQVFTAYGAAEGVWDCPSNGDGVRYINGTIAPPEWGVVTWTDYVYVAGMTATNCGKSTPTWGSVVPAVSERDPQPGERIIAADMVFFSGGDGYKWDEVRRYRINHPQSLRPDRPDFQAILYADGHVEGKGREWYPKALNIKDNFSLQHAAAPTGGFVYWAPGKAGTPVVPAKPPTAPSKAAPPPVTPPKPATPPAPPPLPAPPAPVLLPRPIPG